MSKEQVEILQMLKTCEAFIAKGKTEQALAQLISIPEPKGRTKFVGLSNQFNTLQKQFKEGIITHEELTTRLARVNGSILVVIEEVEGRLKGEQEGTIKTRKPTWIIMLGIGLGVVLLVLGYAWLKPGEIETKNALDCPAERKKAVYVAQFQVDKADGFSSSVVAALRGDLKEEQYRVDGAVFQSFNNSNYYDSIQVNYFEQSCDTSGLFLSGLWDKEDEVFNCYINFFHLTVGIPGLQGHPSIILNNPPGITFSASKDAQFLVDFIVGILKTYQGEAYEALKLFTKLEKDTVLLQDQAVQAYVAHYKGNCYAMRGNEKQAKAHFEKAASLEPKLSEIAKENSQVAAEVFTIMNSDDELKPILLSYLFQDSILATSGQEEPVNDLSEEEPQSEIKVIEAVTEQLKDKAKEEENEHKDATALDQIAENPAPSPAGGKKVDPRDNRSYPTIIINGKTWLAENLNYRVGNSWCYDNKEANCTEYGLLYDWASAIEACKGLGAGWGLPSDQEWREMAKLFGGSDDDAKDGGMAAYKALIKGGSSGFQAILGGWRDSDGSYILLGSGGYYWSSMESDVDNAWGYYFYVGKLTRGLSGKSLGQSCRCLKD